MVSLATCSFGFLMILISHDCRENKSSSAGISNKSSYIQFHCPDGHHSVMAELWLDTPESTVRSLFHNEVFAWSAPTLSVFFVSYFFIACWTYGLSISGGVFIPCLLIGAAGGRLVAVGALNILTGSTWISPGKFALIGAAAMLGGVTRMTISLTVILIEATGNITFGIPIMCSLVIAKWVGDYLSEGLYDTTISLNGVPLLACDPPNLSRNIYASEIMSTPVICFKTTENVGRIVDILKSESHNGFPVVDDGLPSDAMTSVHSDLGYGASGGDRMDLSFNDSVLPSNSASGRFRGLILRHQLIVLLQKKMFNELSDTLEGHHLTLDDFRSAYPRFPSIESVNISHDERKMTIDLRPYMNPSPYVVLYTASLNRIFKLFRALGLRHLVVTNDRNGVIGIVTRKDLARFKLIYSKGRMKLRQLHYSIHDTTS